MSVEAANPIRSYFTMMEILKDKYAETYETCNELTRQQVVAGRLGEIPQQVIDWESRVKVLTAARPESEPAEQAAKSGRPDKEEIDPKVLGTELQNYLEKIIRYKKDRNDLRGMVADYQAAIGDCTPPKLDPHTMNVLEAMGSISKEKVDRRYTLLFTTELGTIKEQYANIQRVSKLIEDQVEKLKWAIYYFPETLPGYPNKFTVNWLGDKMSGKPAHINAMIHWLEEQKKEAKAPEGPTYAAVARREEKKE